MSGSVTAQFIEIENGGSIREDIFDQTNGIGKLYSVFHRA